MTSDSRAIVVVGSVCGGSADGGADAAALTIMRAFKALHIKP